MKPIKSSDPRKPAVLAALKAKANCRKVTTVWETETHYMGSAMWPNPGSTDGLETLEGPFNVRVEKTSVS